jgi:hypothetical protein
MICGAFSPSPSGNVVLQQVAQAAHVVVQFGALGLHGAGRNLEIDSHGELVHGHRICDLLVEHAVRGVGLGAANRVVEVEGRRSHDLIGIVRASPPPDVVNRGEGLVLEHFQQVPIERGRVERLLLVEMPSELQVVSGAPVVQPLDEVLVKQLAAKPEQRHARGGGLRADVVPQRRVILHRRITILLLKGGIETGRPHAIGMVHGRLVVKSLGDEVAEVASQVRLVLLVGHGDEGAHGGLVQIVDHPRPAFRQKEGHHLPVAFGHLAGETILGPAAADVHQFERVAIHHHRAHVDPRGNRQLRLGGPGDVLLGHIQALGGVLRVLRDELAADRAGGKRIVVIQDHLEPLLFGLFERDFVEPEILVAEEADARVILSAAGFDKEPAVIQLGHLLNAGDDAGFIQRREVEVPHGVAPIHGRGGLEDGGVECVALRQERCHRQKEHRQPPHGTNGL